MAAKTNVVPIRPTAADQATPTRAKTETKSNTVRFTDGWVKRIVDASRNQPGHPRWEFKDAELGKLYARVSNGQVSYSVLSRAPGYANAQRIALGRNDFLNVKMAREAGRVELAKLGAGVRVQELKKTLRTLTGKQARTVAELLEDYLENKTIGENARTLAPKSKEKYRTDLNALLGPAMFQPIARLTPQDVAAAYEARKKTSYGGAKTALDALAAICNMHNLPNPCKEVTGVKQIKVRRARLGPDSAPELLAWLLWRIDQPTSSAVFRTYCQMLVIAITMGVRIGAIQVMEWEWLDMRRGMVTFPDWAMKNKAEAALPLPVVVQTMLTERKRAVNDGSKLIFAQQGNPDVPQDLPAKFLIRLPVRCSAHDGRKIFILLASRNGSRLATNLLATHVPEDVEEKNYIRAHSWETLMKDMRPASQAVEVALMAKRYNRATIKAMEALHVEHDARHKAHRNALSKANRVRKAERQAAFRAKLRAV
jgi:hypothetical protein